MIYTYTPVGRAKKGVRSKPYQYDQIFFSPSRSRTVFGSNIKHIAARAIAPAAKFATVSKTASLRMLGAIELNDQMAMLSSLALRC